MSKNKIQSLLALLQEDITAQQVLMESVYYKLDVWGMSNDPHWVNGTTIDEILLTLSADIPPTSHDCFTPAAIVIASILNTTPKDLFHMAPWTHVDFYKEWREFAEEAGERQIDACEIERGLSESDSFNQPDLDDLVHTKKMQGTTQASLLTLLPREERVLRLRFGINGQGRSRHSPPPERALGRIHIGPNNDEMLVDGLFLKEIGEQLNLSHERARAIEAKALGKMSRPAQRRKLARFLEP